MSTILLEAQENTKAAFAVLRKLRAVAAWDMQGAEVHVVGSLINGLYYNSRDIDLHVYTDIFDMGYGFAVMAQIAAQPGVQKITFTNLLDAPDACCEWHVFYKDEQGQDWTLDIIHIVRGSQFDGFFERQATLIKEMLTGETRAAILQIKKALSGTEHIGGIWIYLAVLRDGIRTPEDFKIWYEKQDKNQIITWPEK